MIQPDQVDFCVVLSCCFTSLRHQGNKKMSVVKKKLPEKTRAEKRKTCSTHNEKQSEKTTESFLSLCPVSFSSFVWW